MNIIIRHLRPNELETLYNLIHRDMTWKETNGPYFPYEQPTLQEFRESYLSTYCEGDHGNVIDIDGTLVGSVSFYWEHQLTRWLETGIIIYDKNYWGKGIATIAMKQWITKVFATQNVARVGFTTWSGNTGMMRVAEKLGMQKEAHIRKVRYYNGVYYDSIKYGVLREEW